jgi:hypothetical protein
VIKVLQRWATGGDDNPTNAIHVQQDPRFRLGKRTSEESVRLCALLLVGQAKKPVRREAVHRHRREPWCVFARREQQITLGADSAQNPDYSLFVLR